MSTVPSAGRESPPTAVTGLRIPDRTLSLLRDLVYARTGIHYDEQRITFMRDRLAPLAIERGFDSLLDYYYLLKYDANAEEDWGRAIDALSVQETYFWREFDQVQSLTTTILPQLVALKRSPIRIWSVPCATGEEPLSIAMALNEAGWFNRAAIEIHASDVSPAALKRAAARTYGRRAFRQLPERLRDKYFTANGEQWTIVPEIYSRITSWTQINLSNAQELFPLGQSDVVFCRNVFIYFDEAGIRRVVDRLADLMPSPGFLCVGAAESLLRLTTRFDLRDIAGAYVYVKP